MPVIILKHLGSITALPKIFYFQLNMLSLKNTYIYIYIYNLPFKITLLFITHSNHYTAHTFTALINTHIFTKITHNTPLYFYQNTYSSHGSHTHTHTQRYIYIYIYIYKLTHFLPKTHTFHTLTLFIQPNTHT
jgi:hypothetical protein